MRTVWKALVVAIAIELAAFMFLLVGDWEFLGATDTLGKIGVCLHLPGLLLANRLHLGGNASWPVIIGVPLLVWLVLAYAGCLLAGRWKTRPS